MPVLDKCGGITEGCGCSAIAVGEKSQKQIIPYRFKKGDEVKPIEIKTWGYICGIPESYSLCESRYVVAEDSYPCDSGEPDKYHWWLRLEEFSGIKFIAADFQLCSTQPR